MQEHTPLDPGELFLINNLARGVAGCHFRRKANSPPLERKLAGAIQVSKVLADWNGLMIAALARTSIVLVIHVTCMAYGIE